MLDLEKNYWQEEVNSDSIPLRRSTRNRKPNNRYEDYVTDF